MGYNKAQHVVASAAAEKAEALGVAPEKEVEVEATKSDTPSDSWTKVEIQEWLDENEIAWQSSATKSDLLSLVP